MKRRPLVPLLLSVLLLPACAHHPTSSPSFLNPQFTIAPAPRIAPNDKIKTVAAYTQAAEAALKSLPTSLTQTRGPQRLILATRALAACPSEPTRAYARALIHLLKTYNLDAGPLPTLGTPTLTYAELATVDALSQALMRGPEGDQGPAPAGPNTIPYSLHLQILVLISRDAPSDAAASLAAFNTTNPLPADISMDARLSPDERRQLYLSAWDNFRAHFTDPLRPVLLNQASLASDPATFAYALFYAGNALAAAPDVSRTGHELQDLANGCTRIAKAIQTLDPSAIPGASSSAMPEDGLLKFAAIMDDNITISRAAKSDLTRFFNALAANDDATVKLLSANAEKQTASQWRDYFSLDRPTPVKSLEVLNLGITESPGRISISVKKTDTAGKVDTDQHYVTVHKQNDHWVITEG